MKKEITIQLTVEIDDSEKDFADRIIKNDLEQEIACCSYCYEVDNITIKWVSSQKIRFYEQVITHKTHDKRTRVFYEQKIIANMDDIFYVHAENERKTEK